MKCYIFLPLYLILPRESILLPLKGHPPDIHACSLLMIVYTEIRHCEQTGEGTIYAEIQFQHYSNISYTFIEGSYL